MSYAKHPSSDASQPINKLIEWSKSKDVGIRYNIAKNPNTPMEVLLNYAANETDMNILVPLANCTKCTNELVLTLIENPKVKNSSAFINYLGYTRHLNDSTAWALFDLGCRVVQIAPRLDIIRLKKWVELDKIDRASYLNGLIFQKQQELMKLWIE